MRKKTTPYFILEILEKVSRATLDILLPPRFAHTRMSRQFLGLDTYSKVSRPTFATALSRLKREGLVAKNKEGWSITERGRLKLYLFRKKIIPDEDGTCRLVIFDIPERERSKRDRVRLGLVAHNFVPLQKSVWQGYRPLSEEFVELIDVLDLKNKLHIFSVQNKGTLGKD